MSKTAAKAAPKPVTEPLTRSKVLIIDNDEPHALTMADGLERVGFDCTTATSGPEGLKQLERNEFDVIITDLVMNDVGGLEVLARAKDDQPDAEVILVTGHGTVPSAVEAMQQGAFNYLLKPLDINQLRAVTEKAAVAARLRRTNIELNRRLDEKFGFEGVVGTSTKMNDLIGLLKRVAPTNAAVLIQGETGTGKELVAQAIHHNSPRKNKPFVALNCAALSDTILESELFGHVAGAFTDARHDRIGKFEYANGGTLFLDEVGDMPMPTQIKLLRVLESSEITRVGSNEQVKVNVRIISATNRNLEQAIAAGTFRSDLYHRLKVVTIVLPRLVDRREDIPLLIEHFMKQFAKQHEKTVKSMSTAARRRMMAYDWPGNVRELRNAVERMIVVDMDGVLDVDDLPSELVDPATEETAGTTVEHPVGASPAGGVGLASLVGRPLEEIERMFITETLTAADGNREEAARMLAIGERTLYRKIKEYGL
ncbi:MAG: sigma-54 dependent transcriptional regulator [Planctomycetia bacterium]|nr:sigma-54 dependent transcriptional regulator [Planctomycetia bacterium]